MVTKMGARLTSRSDTTCLAPVWDETVFNLCFSHLESKVQRLESQQRGELENMREEKNRLQVRRTNAALARCPRPRSHVR